MKTARSLFFALAALLVAVPATAGQDDFDYARTQGLYAVTDSEAIFYATFPGFLALREQITNRMRDAESSAVENPDVIYTLRLIGMHEQTTLYVGEAWIGDGERYATLSNEQFDRIRNAVESRTGQGIPLAELESHVQYQVDAQKDPAWRPAP